MNDFTLENYRAETAARILAALASKMAEASAAETASPVSNNKIVRTAVELTDLLIDKLDLRNPGFTVSELGSE